MTSAAMRENPTTTLHAAMHTHPNQVRWNDHDICVTQPGKVHARTQARTPYVRLQHRFSYHSTHDVNDGPRCATRVPVRPRPYRFLTAPSREPPRFYTIHALMAPMRQQRRKPCPLPYAHAGVKAPMALDDACTCEPLPPYLSIPSLIALPCTRTLWAQTPHQQNGPRTQHANGSPSDKMTFRFR